MFARDDISLMRHIRPISRNDRSRARQPSGARHLRHGALVATLAVALLALLQAVLPHPAMAQTGDLGGGELNPFPKDDVYQVHFIGDWWMDGLRPVLEDSLKTLPRLRPNKDVIELRSLRRTSWDDGIAAVTARGASSQLDISIVMFGASEFGSVFTPERQRFGTDEWTRVYAARVDRLMKTLKSQKGAVYWIGLPVVRRRDHSEAFQLINTVLRERAYLNGVNFIDTYTRFQDESGGFSRYGPDLAGTIKLLRSKDGVYFTSDGYAKISQLVMQMVRRDLASVKTQRVVSLAGSEEELAIVRARAQPDRQKPGQPAKKTGGTDEKKAPSPIFGRLQGGGLPADDVTIDVPAGLNGARLRLELPRPALSAAVMSLVTRNQSKDKPARLGDNAVEVASGGIPLMSTITPADQSALALRKRRLSPTQSTFFKVWGKGERLDPKPGRADDFTWPRPAPEPVVHVTARPADRTQPLRAIPPPRDPNLPPLPVQNPLR